MLRRCRARYRTRPACRSRPPARRPLSAANAGRRRRTAWRFLVWSLSPPSTHHRRGALDRAQDAHMRAAAALEAGERLPDLGVGRLLGLIEERGRRHDPAVDAVTALRDLLLHVGLLDRMRLLERAEAGKGDDLAAAHRRHRRHAGPHRLAVDVHGAGAALRQSAAEMRVVVRELVAQRVEQRHVGIGVDRVDLAVHVEGHSGHGCMSPLGCREATDVPPISGLPEIGSGSWPSRPRPTWAAHRPLCFPRNCQWFQPGEASPRRRHWKQPHAALLRWGSRASSTGTRRRAYPESTANARTDAIKSRTCVSEMPRVMNTSRLARSLSGQSASSTGGWARCWTTCTTTGPRQPATLSKPFTRRRSGPRSAISVSMPRAKASQGSGASSVRTKLAMPSLCSASATKPAREAAALGDAASLSSKQRASRSPLTAV